MLHCREQSREAFTESKGCVWLRPTMCHRTCKRKPTRKLTDPVTTDNIKRLNREEQSKQLFSHCKFHSHLAEHSSKNFLVFCDCQHGTKASTREHCAVGLICVQPEYNHFCQLANCPSSPHDNPVSKGTELNWTEQIMSKRSIQPAHRLVSVSDVLGWPPRM